MLQINYRKYSRMPIGKVVFRLSINFTSGRKKEFCFNREEEKLMLEYHDKYYQRYVRGDPAIESTGIIDLSFI